VNTQATGSLASANQGSETAASAKPDDLLLRLRKFHDDYFPGVKDRFKHLVDDGQHPGILFIGCSDSRIVPYLLTGTGPGELFIVRNVGAFIPPHDGSAGYHGTAAAIEFAVLNLKVSRNIVCGHSHCGGIRALYEEVSPEATNLSSWLELGREAALRVKITSGASRHTNHPAVVLQLERLMGYPMVRKRVESGLLTLHGWHYVIEDGEIHVFDVQTGAFVPASLAEHSGTGPYTPFVDEHAAHNCQPVAQTIDAKVASQ
jgi:carbonic anhydrase